MAESEAKAITRNTRVTIGAVGSVAVAILAVFGFLNARFASIDESLTDTRESISEINFSLREIRTSIDTLNHRSEVFVSRDRFLLWLEVLKAMNPDVIIPPFGY